ncbi:MAG TPA: lactate racemase domain-containing protein [Phycisphaerae bacterium]|nr:lactate racemase domain-containing protein [Phycisphaerae bacterium]
MPDISVPWGGETLPISLPPHWKIQQIAQPNLQPAPEDWSDRMALAIGQPGTGPALGELLSAVRGGRVELIVEDITRPSPLPEILSVVMREIRHAGIKNEQIEIFFATGMHHPMTSPQVARKLGPAVEGIAWRCNPWQSRPAYVNVGRVGKMEVLIDRRVAEADVRIVISSVSPHAQAGYGGGHKMLLPGCAHLETIGALHRLGVYRTPRQLVGMDPERNPMRRAIDAGGELLDRAKGRTFTVQYLLDHRHMPAFVAAGLAIPTHRMVAKRCSVACGIVTESPGDVVIANAHPLDFDLWQSFKCIGNTRWSARPGGLIICLTRCEAGLGDMKVPRWPMSPRWTRRALAWLGPEAISSLVTRVVPRLAGDSAFFARMALQTIHRNPVFIASPTLYEAARKFPGVELFPTAQDAIAAGEALLGSAQQRVMAFPSGGISFPIRPPAGASGR